MQDTLLHNSLSPHFPYNNFPSLPPPPPKSLHFPTSLSSKTTTISLPIKPPKSPEIPSIPSSSSTPISFQEKVLFLDSIGIDIFSLINHHRPIILQSSIDDIKSTLNFLTSMNFTSAEFRRIISMCPEILTVNAATILPVFTFLLREARVNGSDLKRVINRRPRLLISCVKNRLRPTLYFLQSIGIAQVNKHTYLLSCSVEDKLLPRIQCFEKLGFSYTDAVLMFRRFPQLFNYSVEDNIEPKFNYFVVEMGRELRELREFPQYFSFSLENRIKPRHQCCVDKGVCFNLKVLLKSSEAEFRQRLEICCGNSVPRRDSPLSSVHSRYTHEFDTQ